MLNLATADKKKSGTPESAAHLSFTKLHGHTQLILTFLFWFKIEQKKTLKTTIRQVVNFSHKPIS